MTDIPADDARRSPAAREAPDARDPEAHPPGTAPPTTLGLSNDKLGMWTFIASDCLFFGALISTYLIYVGRTNDGPSASLFDIPFTSASTFILLMSSLGMVLALAAAQENDWRTFRTWILATALMGAVFLSGQVYEFTQFAREGMILSVSPFTSSFFVLTGFHGIHVAIGVVMLITLWTRSMVDDIGPGNVEVIENIGLYWHFVDIVWIIIFTVIYLIPAEGVA